MLISITIIVFLPKFFRNYVWFVSLEKYKHIYLIKNDLSNQSIHIFKISFLQAFHHQNNT